MRVRGGIELYRRGHVGMALLAYAPAGLLLLREGRLGLALLGLFGVLAVEPLPDNDHWIPWLSHRGTSHSLFCAVVIGAILGGFGWIIGELLAGVVANTLAGGNASSVGIFAGVFDWLAIRVRGLDGPVLAQIGFVVGVYGIFVHLLADAITIAGIRPLLPLSRRRVSLSSVQADSPLANNALFGLGVLVVALVLFATAPGVGFAVPADLSPVDVAAGQSQNTSGASVEFANQTTNGSTVTVERARLPEGGFIVLDSSAYGEEGLLEEDTIAVSKHLSPGTHRNVTLRVAHSPPGGIANRSTLTNSNGFEAILYRDSNNNSRFEYITSGRSVDKPYIVSSGSNARIASDPARITVSGTQRTPTPTASIRFHNQTTNGSTVTVRSVTLPDGGWVVVHNESYLRRGNPLQSAIGLSAYLSPGTHRNVSVTLLNGSVQRTQTLIAIPSRDTNDNQRYDYIRSDGFQDVAYTAQGQIITDRATVAVHTDTATSTPTRTPTPTPTSTPTFTSTSVSSTVTPDTAIPTATVTSTPVRTATPTVQTQEAAGTNDGGGWLANNLLMIGAGVVVVGGYAVRKLRS